MVVAISILVAIFAFLAYGLVHQPIWTTLFLSIIAGEVVRETWVEKKRLRCLSAHRSGESICTFARAINARERDTWVVRSVYEQIQSWLPVAVPLRPSDDFSKDLRLGDDLEEIAEEAAFHAGRSFRDVKSNPLYGKVFTVQDLVEFISAQPVAVLSNSA
jgi:hypothetical protein